MRRFRRRQSACTASRLEAILFSWGGGVGGHPDMPLLFRNRDSRQCFLEGYPDITILDSAGNALATAAGTAQRGTFFDAPGWVVPILMRTDTPSLQSVADSRQAVPGQARLNVEWYDCAAPLAAQLRIELPAAGGHLVIPFAVKGGYSPVCDGGTPRSGLLRGMFTPTDVEWPPGPSHLPVTIALDVPPSVTHGTTLTYYVTLTNTGTADYPLSPCPDYMEFIGDKQGIGEFGLNCAGAGGHVAPGTATRFEMRLQVPGSIPAGPTRLEWALLDFRIGALPATAELTIT